MQLRRFDRAMQNELQALREEMTQRNVMGDVQVQGRAIADEQGHVSEDQGDGGNYPVNIMLTLCENRLIPFGAFLSVYCLAYKGCPESFRNRYDVIDVQFQRHCYFSK